MPGKEKKEYAAPEIDKIYVTADAVLDSGESGGIVPPKQGEDEGELDWFSLS